MQSQFLLLCSFCHVQRDVRVYEIPLIHVQCWLTLHLSMDSYRLQSLKLFFVVPSDIFFEQPYKGIIENRQVEQYALCHFRVHGEQAARTQTLTKKNPLTTHSVEA